MREIVRVLQEEDVHYYLQEIPESAILEFLAPHLLPLRCYLLRYTRLCCVLQVNTSIHQKIDWIAANQNICTLKIDTVLGYLKRDFFSKYQKCCSPKLKAKSC